MTEEKQRKLTKKQEVFIEEYALCLNATEAAKRAGYSEKSARQTGCDLMADPYISVLIQEQFKKGHVTPDEALKLQGDIARGDITEFLTPLGHLDIDLLRDSGKGRLVKKIKQRTITKIGKGEKDDDTEIHETEIELYPADVAQERILKVAGKFKDSQTINVNMSWKDFVKRAENEILPNLPDE